MRCQAARPADPAKEELSWSCLYSDFSLKPSTKKCRLNHLRLVRFSVLPEISLKDGENLT